MTEDVFKIGDKVLSSRFILGSGKTSHYTPELVRSAIYDAGVDMISIAVRYLEDAERLMAELPDTITYLPNTLGASTAREAIDMAHTARDRGLGNLIKIEIMNDSKYLLPDNNETLEATRVLSEEGYVVLPYIYPGLPTGRKLVEAGAAALIPLASPSGSSKGLATRDFIQQYIAEFDVPIIVDAGIGHPYQACEAMELGCDGVMANTALATAGNLPLMAGAFRSAVIAGRQAYLSQIDNRA